MKIKYLSVLPIIAILILSGVSLVHAQSDVFTQNLYYGLQNNSQVTQLQEFLTSQGLYSGPVTGNFYFLTMNAVKAFQTQQGITPVAGYFGPMTMAAANKIADAEVGASNTQAISETGIGTPPTTQASSTMQLLLESLLRQVAILEQQLQAQQSSTQALQQIAVNTQPQAPTANISANGCSNSITIPYNTVATINWSSTNANSCNISPSGWSGTSGLQGTINLTASQTYSISCSGSGGSASASVILNVAAAQPAPTSTIVCTPNWQCNSWSICLSGQQTRTCTDTNNCGVLTNKPTLMQSCAAPAPTPAKAGIYKIPVLVLSYIPLKNGKIDTSITGDIGTDNLEILRTKIDTLNNQIVSSLDEGSEYRGYKNSDVIPSLDYSILEKKEFLGSIPSDNGTRQITDGNPETGKWAPTPSFVGDYLLIDLGSSQNLNKITPYFWATDRPQEFHIDASASGNFAGEETRIVTETDGLSGYSRLPNSAIEKKEYNFTPISTRFLKLVVDKYRADNPEGFNSQINLYEFGASYNGIDLSLSDAKISANEGFRTPAPVDHTKIFNDLNICNYVENLGLKEVWVWMYHADKVYPVESYQVGPGHAMGNGYMDLPLCAKSYTVFDYNYGRSAAEAVEDHTHHLEAVFNYIDGRDSTPADQWTNLLFWGKFVGSDSSLKIISPGCGWTHYPPNGLKDYDWQNEQGVLSDCEDWKPDRSGEKKLISCHTWSGDVCSDDGGLRFKIWWMQNIPGKDNGLVYNGKQLKNWWDFIGNFDQAIQAGKSLTY